MGLFAMEHGKAAYRADFVLYGTAIASLATILFIAGPNPQRAESLAWVCAGLVSWTAIEKRRKRWHAMHHHDAGRLGGFGVTSTFWDHVLGSAIPRAASVRQRS